MANSSKAGWNPKFLQAVYSVGVTAGLSDGQLGLDQFLAGRDGVNEVAFTALMERHGPMVFQVCKQILGNSHDAEDALQATFFVLIRKAKSIRKSNSVGSWLYGVARLVAKRAQNEVARHHRTYELHAERTASTSSDESSRPEDWATLHEQIDRMPDKYREPVVLCYLEGLTTEAVAQRLGARKGRSFLGLHSAKERLRVSLSRGNLSLPAQLYAPRLALGNGSSINVGASSFEGTVRACLRFSEKPVTAATSGSAAAVVLANGVLRSMMMTPKLKIYGQVVFSCLILTGGAHALARQLDNGQGNSKPKAGTSATEKRRLVSARPVEDRKAETATKASPAHTLRAATTLENSVKRISMSRSRLSAFSRSARS